MASTEKLLVTNRGDIAVRIPRPAHEMGMATVAVDSDPDRSAPHVTQASEAFHMGPASVWKSSLNLDRIIEVSAKASVDACHLF